MKIHIVDSGSKQNTYILESETSQLIIELGCKWSDIIQSLRFYKKIAGCIVSHGTANSKDKINHIDHSRSQFEALKSGIDVFGKHNLEHNKQYTIGEEWIVKPISAPHGEITSFNFIIYNKAERKHIFFATDCSELPRIADKYFDCMLLETNYDIDVLLNRADSIENKGYLNHLSVQQVEQWLSSRQSRVGTLILCHLSNSSNIQVEGLVERFNGLCGECHIATKGKEIII